jgi:transposase
VVADRWYPSSKTCSACGAVKTKLRAPRGALSYRPYSGHGPEEVSVGLMAYLDP